MTATGGGAPVDREPLRVLYADNDPLALRAFETLLGGIEGLAFTAVDGRVDAILAAIGGHRRPVVLLDLYLGRGEGDGIALAQLLNARDPGLPVAICTASDSSLDAWRAWSAGVRAFLTKQQLLRRRDLLAVTLRAVSDGAVVYDLDPRAAGSPNPLSSREVEVLQRKRDGRAHREIADELCVSIRTIDSHLANIRSKLAAESIHHALQIAVDRGILRGHPEGGASGA